MARRVLFRGQQMRNRMIAFRRPVFLHPLAAQPCGFLRRQPGPFGAAGANRDPNGLSVHVFLNRERASLRHRHTHFRNENDRLCAPPAEAARQTSRLTNASARLATSSSPTREARTRDICPVQQSHRNRKMHPPPQKCQNRQGDALACAFGHNPNGDPLLLKSREAPPFMVWKMRRDRTSPADPPAQDVRHRRGRSSRCGRSIPRIWIATFRPLSRRSRNNAAVSRDPGSFLAASAAIVAISATVSRRKK